MEVLDEKATAMIFLNIEDILLTNTVRVIAFLGLIRDLSYFLKSFLSTLEERQRDCRLYVDRIGDLLEKHMPNMAVYLVCLPLFRYHNLFHLMWLNHSRATVSIKRMLERSSSKCGRAIPRWLCSCRYALGWLV